MDVLECQVAVGEKEVAGKIRIIFGHRTRGGVAADVGETGFVIERGQIGAAHGTIVIQQHSRTERSALVVQVLRMFEVANSFVEPVLLPQVKR